MVAALPRAGASATARPGASTRRLEAFRWLLEELRVSLFAQELKTPVPGVVQAGGKGLGGRLTAERPSADRVGSGMPPCYSRFARIAASSELGERRHECWAVRPPVPPPGRLSRSAPESRDDHA